MRLDLISLLLSLDLVTDTRLRTVAMRFFVGAFCRVAKRGMDIIKKKKKKKTYSPLWCASLPHLRGTLGDSDSLQTGRVQLPPENWLCA